MELYTFSTRVKYQVIYFRTLIPIGEKIVSIAGACGGILSSSKRHSNIDFAFVDIAEELHDRIKMNNSILKYKIFADKCDFQESDSCVFVGYLYRKTKTRQNNVFSSRLHEYVGSYVSEEGIYENMGYNKNENIIIRYDFKLTSNRKGEYIRPIVSPEGVSGGGIFINSVTMKNQDDRKKTKLAGVAHTFDRKKKVMIGTNIETYLKVIQSFM